MFRSFLLLVLLLASCTSVPPAPAPLVRPAGAEHKPFVLNGRISVKQEGDRTSANIRWAHSADKDDILLLAPLGQTVARIHRDAQEVVLDTADKHYTAQDAGELTQKVLGWKLPLSGLGFWVLGMPAPESKAIIGYDTNGQINLLQQDGWNISYTRYAGPTTDSLPLRLSLKREGMDIQLLVDEWDIH